MQVYLLRHGIAENARPGAADRNRALTPEGKKKLRDVLRVAKAAGVEPGIVVTSPYRRAQESAEIAREVLDFKDALSFANCLVPGGDPPDVWAEIRSLRVEQVLLVSHEPLCGRLLAYLLGCPPLDVEFKKGAIARIDIEPSSGGPRGSLQWLLTAKLAEGAAK